MNLLKCDNCGNRNILCFNCESNEHYRKTDFSHDEYVKRKAIEEYVEAVREQFVLKGRPLNPDEHYITVPEAIEIVRKGGVKNE